VGFLIAGAIVGKAVAKDGWIMGIIIGGWVGVLPALNAMFFSDAIINRITIFGKITRHPQVRQLLKDGWRFKTKYLR
jgi:hypothetical protein